MTAAGPSIGRAGRLAAAALLAVLVLGALVFLARQGHAPPPTDQASADLRAGDDAPPDLGQMTPRERFDRLYNRIMRATESGDQATATTFTRMALLAYGQLDTLDADARYHAALLRVHSGDVLGPLALADSILAQSPGHLFGYVIRGTVARWRQDPQELQGAYRGFLDHYDREIQAGRPEYQDHRRALEEFHRVAASAVNSRSGGP